MTRLRDVLFDRWTAFSFKGPVSERAGKTHLAPTWVGEEHRRRLSVYTLCRAYIDNVSRTSLDDSTVEARPWGSPDAVEENQRAGDSGVAQGDRREYGDAALLVAAVADAVLGDDLAIVVPDAAEEPPPAPVIPPEPDTLPDDASEFARRARDVMVRRWEQVAERAVDEWERRNATYDAAVERQQWLRDWAENERLVLKLLESEHDAVGLADSVLVIGWDPEKNRPVLRVYDPGFYFPVLDPAGNDEFPRRLHIAWEFELTDADGNKTKFVRRITWELAELGEAREYPWRPGRPSKTACFMTDATWPLEQLNNLVGVDGFTGGTYMTNTLGQEVNRLDIGVDFIPVIHVPNTPAGKEHFGQSLLAPIAQILDDIQGADTDATAASRLAGMPVLHMRGATASSGTAVVSPGAVFTGGDGMDVLDMSSPLRAVEERRKGLRDLLSVNSQVIAEALGRVLSSEVPSGITVALMFGPMRRLIRKLRLVRKEKHPLILEFAQRFAQLAGVLPAGENPRADVAYGSFLPYDQKGLVDMLASLLANKGVSRRTALRWMAENGFDLDDLSAELRELQSEDFDGADKLSLIVGEAEAAEYLGRTPPPAPRVELRPPPEPSPESEPAPVT